MVVSERLRRPRGSFSVAALGVLALAASACSSSSTSASTHSTPSTVINVGQTAELAGNFDPYNLVPSNFSMMYQLYDTLIRQSPNLTPEPRLASSWKLASNGLSMTLQLRSAKFSNGKPITSQSIAYDISLVEKKSAAANIRVLTKDISSVGTPSPHQLVLDFSKPFPAIFDFLNLLFVVNKTTVDSSYKTVVASGPFQLSQYTPGVGFSLKRNPYFWGPKPSLTGVNVKFLSNDQTLMNALQTGSIDFADLIAPLDAKNLKGNTKYVTGVPPVGNSAFAFGLNVNSSPLNNVDVRDALSLALDRQRIAKVALDGEASAACLPFIAPTQLGYNKQLANSCNFNLAAAKKKLQESGLPASALSFTVTTSSSANPVLTQMTEIFQADLAKIGVTVHIQDVASPEWNADALSGNFQALATVYGRANLDPSTLFGADTLWQPVGNNTHFSSPAYTSAIDQAGSTYSKKVRTGLYLQADKIILQQNFALVVASNPRPYATSNKIHGLNWAVNGQPFLEGVTVG